MYKTRLNVLSQLTYVMIRLASTNSQMIFFSWLGRSQLIISQGYEFSVQATIFSRLLFATAQLVAHLRRMQGVFQKERKKEVT